ncbi:MAG: glucosaminidase domain-containing protein [Puniceicoccales bacterium]|nr:glucosaminidase domain-containing protein [Puniceicoccales bacterium]
MGFIRRFPLLLLALGFVGCSSVHLHRRETERIMGSDSISTAQMERFLLRHNGSVGHGDAKKIATCYLQECQQEGVRPAVAFCQMCLETNFLSFPGSIARDQNNFCGYGVTASNYVGATFPDLRTGVRTHVQHLKAYATAEPTRRRCIDSRRRSVYLGSAPTVNDLAGRWNSDPNYGNRLCELIGQLRAE